MEAKISKWGNSYAIRIPASVVKAMALKENSTVYLSQNNKDLTISTQDRDKRFKEMMSKITTKNRHKLVNFGEAAGKERFWEDD